MVPVSLTGCILPVSDERQWQDVGKPMNIDAYSALSGGKVLLPDIAAAAAKRPFIDICVAVARVSAASSWKILGGVTVAETIRTVRAEMCIFIAEYV
ncbi:hypothetical protein [Rhizobium sp.]|uniref:hypothetical protein n=1 Tax=Rhizobium sp. TaxID=391 RepID=UPI002F24AF12